MNNILLIDKTFIDAELAGWTKPGWYFSDGEKKVRGPYATAYEALYAMEAFEAEAKAQELAGIALNLVGEILDLVPSVECMTNIALGGLNEIESLERELATAQRSNADLQGRLDSLANGALDLFGDLLKIDRKMDEVFEKNERETARFNAERAQRRPVLPFIPWSKEREIVGEPEKTKPSEYDRFLTTKIPATTPYDAYGRLIEGDIVVARHFGKTQVRRVLAGGLNSEVIAGDPNHHGPGSDAIPWTNALVLIRHADGTWVKGFDKPRYRIVRSSPTLSMNDSTIFWPVRLGRFSNGMPRSYGFKKRWKWDASPGAWDDGCYDVLIRIG